MVNIGFDFRIVFILCWIAILGCQAKQTTSEKKSTLEGIKNEATDLAEWYGVYASYEEHSGIEGQVLVLFDSPLCENGGGEFRMKAWTDYGVSSRDEVNIKLDEVSGEFLTAGKQVYVPISTGRTANGKVTALRAAIKRYTRVTINQEVVLLPDHALERFGKGESLKTVGILIKLHVADDAYRHFEMSSLKCLPSEKLIEK